MTDRYNCLIVSLEKDIREDDAKRLINAIKMIKGVNGVTGNIIDADTYMATQRVNKMVIDNLHELMDKISKM